MWWWSIDYIIFSAWWLNHQPVVRYSNLTVFFFWSMWVLWACFCVRERLSALTLILTRAGLAMDLNALLRLRFVVLQPSFYVESGEVGERFEDVDVWERLYKWHGITRRSWIFMIFITKTWRYLHKQKQEDEPYEPAKKWWHQGNKPPLTIYPLVVGHG